MTASWSRRLDQLSDEGLSALLSVALSSGRPASWLPTSSAGIVRARASLAAVADTSGDGPAAWLDEVAEPSTSLARLVAVKRAAKALVRSVEDEGTRTAAILVYHAAIAAAFARHATVISSRPPGLRLGLYDGLAAALGDHPLGRVFRAAVDRYLAA